MFIAFIVQLVVCILILRWLLKRKVGEPFSKKTVAKFFGFGALALAVALGVSMALNIKDELFFGLNPLLAGFITALLTAALYEECVKYVFLRLALWKSTEVVSWLDVIIAAAVFGGGFTLLEDLEFALTGSTNIARAFFPGHILFQLVMGYFLGRARETKQKKYDVLALVVPILLHTLFDTFIIALMAAIGDLSILENPDPELVMQLPYFGYIIPLTVGVISVGIATVVGIIVMCKKIDKWSKEESALELRKQA